uniref:Uncharacterized protein n=1 Tax=Oryza sativa subsp. japonica TaxID=39947 RepID=Q6UUK7_ORYSJ|nr:hypothetical protein OSJNBa0017M13.15 [Oryza sativa Japonica Group]
MGATLLLLCADFSAVAGGRRRPSLPSEPRLAAPAAGSRAPPSRASVRPSAAAAPLAARGLPHHASVAGNPMESTSKCNGAEAAQPLDTKDDVEPFLQAPAVATCIGATGTRPEFGAQQGPGPGINFAPIVTPRLGPGEPVSERGQGRSCPTRPVATPSDEVVSLDDDRQLHRAAGANARESEEEHLYRLGIFRGKDGGVVVNGLDLENPLCSTLVTGFKLLRIVEAEALGAPFIHLLWREALEARLGIGYRRKGQQLLVRGGRRPGLDRGWCSCRRDQVWGKAGLVLRFGRHERNALVLVLLPLLVGDEKLNYLGCHQGPGSR